MSLPGLFLISKRVWLKIHSWLVLVCATVTLILGLVIWFLTLETRTNMGAIWARQTPSMQQLLQQKVHGLTKSTRHTD